jgi:ubiquinone/menaquinone biosynthesis C-methylase UbiE
LEDLNLETYRDKQTVHWYVNHETLFPPEATIFEHYRLTLEGKKILDIGVGGGRTALHLSKLTDDYVGIDYSPEMVKGCQLKFPEMTFLECDARDLAPFQSESFDVVLFSWNGIDYVNHENRIRILQEVARVLKPSGYFIFSCHNRDFMSKGPMIEPTRHPLKFLARRFRFYQGKIRHVLRKHKEIHTDEYCVVNDASHEYKLMTYYITPSQQKEQLHQHGFAGPVSMFGTNGRPLEAPTADDSEYVYYCVQKSG